MYSVGHLKNGALYRQWHGFPNSKSIQSRYVLNFANTPIQEKTGSCMEARPKGPSAFAAPGGKNKWLSKKVSRWSK